MVGRTAMGKSHAARVLAGDILARGRGVLVCDPYMTRWPASYITRDVEALRQRAEKSQRCAIFIDEAGRLVGRGAMAKAHQWFTTESRHEPYLHQTYLIAQAAQQLDPTLRGQCSRGYIFRLSPGDARFVSDLFAEDLTGAASLDVGQFYYVAPGVRPALMRFGAEKREALTESQ